MNTFLYMEERWTLDFSHVHTHTFHHRQRPPEALDVTAQIFWLHSTFTIFLMAIAWDCLLNWHTIFNIHTISCHCSPKIKIGVDSYTFSRSTFLMVITWHAIFNAPTIYCRSSPKIKLESESIATLSQCIRK